MWYLCNNPAHLAPWLVSTNSVKATAEQPTNNGYWQIQYTTFTGNIEVHSMCRTHGKASRLQTSLQYTHSPVPAAAHLPSPKLLAPTLRI